MTKRSSEAAVQEEAVSNTSVASHMYEEDPNNYGEAMRSAKSKNLQIAMPEELEALESNDFWSLIKRPVGSNALHTKWFTRRRQPPTEMLNASKHDS